MTTKSKDDLRERISQAMARELERSPVDYPSRTSDWPKGKAVTPCADCRDRAEAEGET